MAKQHMSLESMIDEERRDVLALLERTSNQQARGIASSAGSGRASSPFTSPQSPVRSMLDIEAGGAPRPSSIAGTNNGISRPPRSVPIRSMLDIDSSPPRNMTSIQSAQISPTETNHRAALMNGSQHRSLSDTASRPAEFGPRAPGSDPTSAYQFSGYLTSNPGGPIVPKRNTQAGKKNAISNAMAEVVRGGDLTSFGARDRGRNQSVAGTGITSFAKSKSPHNRFGLRSNSPHSSMLNPEPNIVLNNGQVVDKNSAYRRLSDTHLANSAGSLSSLSDKARRRRIDSGNAVGPGDARLEKDYASLEGGYAVAESSDEDDGSSEEDRNRGRMKEIGESDTSEADPESSTLNMGRAKGPRTALSLMAAAEEERQEVAAQQNVKYTVRSLLDLETKATGPSGGKPKSAKPQIHPNTSFDEMASGINTPVDSDTEADLTDIKRAQNLSVMLTAIVSTPVTSRCVRTIYRGDFALMQQEAQDDLRRIRKYLVATDLSDEAAHALEWTIGTVLRDGDTLLAIYCVDEGLGIVPNDVSGDDSQLKEQVAAIAASTRPSNSTPIVTPAPVPSPLGPGFKLESSSASASPMGRERDKAEQERYRAVEKITERVSKLLRKTKLQVKVVIEVIHCKSPKHLITEVIDYISPTMVILGSRGRRALKGAILGSFSKYLVTKSSVPVMVARKRLRKQSKHKRPRIRLANNLANPAVKSLELADGQ